MVIAYCHINSVLDLIRLIHEERLAVCYHRITHLNQGIEKKQQQQKKLEKIACPSQILDPQLADT